MKIIESYFHILNQIKLIINDKIESEAETSLIFSSRLFQEYFGQRLEKEEIFGKFSDYDLEENMLITLNNIISKRSNGIPIQYILDEAWFYGYSFHVYKSDSIKTLIPRNETELIVEKFIEYSNTKTKKISVIDIGTGSCCIPISIILNDSNIDSFDAIDPHTFEIAKKNISNYKLEERINLYNIGIEEILSTLNTRYDIITANLPYIPEDKKIKELNFEPDEALYANDNGLHYIKMLIDILPRIIRKNGIAILEIDPKHTDYLNDLKNFKVSIFKDLNNLDRIAEIKLR
tara:strand:- start:376 stop:1245 length:870 start_codon:yes stop_codon:yes gene_type:complete